VLDALGAAEAGLREGEILRDAHDHRVLEAGGELVEPAHAHRAGAGVQRGEDVQHDALAGEIGAADGGQVLADELEGRERGALRAAPRRRSPPGPAAGRRRRASPEYPAPPRRGRGFVSAGRSAERHGMTLTAITNAHVVPIEGDPFDGTVLVRDGRLTALGPELEIPDGAEVVDAAGGWLLPGFVVAHVHLGVAEEGEGW